MNTKLLTLFTEKSHASAWDFVYSLWSRFLDLSHSGKYFCYAGIMPECKIESAEMR